MAKEVIKWECKDGTMFDSEDRAYEYEYKTRIAQEVNDLMQYVDGKTGIEMSWKGLRGFICNHSHVLYEILKEEQ